MPLIKVQMFDDKPQELKNQLAQKLTDEFSSVTGIPKEVIWVMFEDVPAKDWYISGKALG